MRTALVAILLLCALHTFSQNAKPAKDTLAWTDGTVSAGTIVKEDKDGQVTFVTEDGVTHIVSSSSIARLKRASTTVNNTAMPSDNNLPSAAATTTYNADNHIDWSDPRIPERIVRKHRAGIGLTIAGVVLVGAGIGMLAAGIANNGQTTTYTTGSSTQTNVNIGGVGVVGILAIIAGIPMTIVGAVRLGKSNKFARNKFLTKNNPKSIYSH